MLQQRCKLQEEPIASFHFYKFIIFTRTFPSLSSVQQHYSNVQSVLCQVPITIDVEVPNELHRLLAGQKRRELMQTYDVHILLPPNDDPSDIIKVYLP